LKIRRFRSAKAAIRAARALANKLGRPVKVIVRRRSRRNPQWLSGTPARSGPSGYEARAFFDAGNKLRGELFTKGDEARMLLHNPAPRAVRAAIRAAQQLANRLRRPVKVTVPRGTLAPSTRHTGRRTVELPAETMRQVVFERRNPTGIPFSGEDRVNKEGQSIGPGYYRPKHGRKRPRIHLDEYMAELAAAHLDIREGQRRRNPDADTARYLAEAQARGFQDPESKDLGPDFRRAKALAAKAARSVAALGGFLEVQEARPGRGRSVKRKAQQAAMFTAAELGAPQRDLFRRR
jgi:hypothetical protein